jgi:DNA-binding response OmpR family regulator
MENNTILVIDDDRNILEIVKLYLTKEGFSVQVGERGDTALALFREAKPALVVLDVMLPGLDGWKVLHQLRQESDTPVIMLTAKGDTLDRVQGLDLGADDYMVKPFDAKELLARVKAVLRRSTTPEAERVVSAPGLTVSLETYAVTLDDKVIEMPPKEIELLYFLASHEGRVFTREQLLEQVSGFDFFGDSRTVDVHVKRIREKLGERETWQIKTVWGVGYKFELARDQ